MNSPRDRWGKLSTLAKLMRKCSAFAMICLATIAILPFRRGSLISTLPAQTFLKIGASFLHSARVLVPNALTPHYLGELAFARLAVGDLGESIEAARQALGVEPDLVGVRFNLAKALAKNGQTHEALTCINSLERDCPLMPEVYLSKAILAASLKDWDIVIATYKRLAKLRPLHWRESVSLGYAYEEREMFQYAHYSYRDAYMLNSDDKASLWQAGFCAYCANMIEESERDLKLSIAYHHELFPSYVLLANLSMRRMDLDEARKSALLALQQYNGNADFLEPLAQVFDRLEMPEELYQVRVLIELATSNESQTFID